MSLLDEISEKPQLLREISLPQLAELAEEIRKLIIEVVSKNGGHLASNLGVVELTIALHRIFTIPPDKLIFDVGHQCYVHKILTGRKNLFPTLRKENGLSGFPDPKESPADTFVTGHAGTAVSQATGLRLGEEITGDNSYTVAVIGDGSLTNGLTLEGLNFLGGLRKRLLIILNDNKMSISPTRGALSYYLTRIVTSPRVIRQKEELRQWVKRIPSIGDDLLRLAEELEIRTKDLLLPGILFEKLGLRYLGPIDGHDFQQLLEILTNLKQVREPVLLHVVTKKGKGYPLAEEKPEDFHGTGPFEVKTGKGLSINGPAPATRVARVLEDLASQEKKLVVLTAAMEKGLELESFARNFPERFFDVGIAESHCVSLASGIARAGLRPVVAIYSTFLQRAYDQILHDVCLQGLPVVFLVDRAGVVGEDGTTHQGIFDLSYLRTIPGLKILAPYSLENLENWLRFCLRENVPCALRYPRTYLPASLAPSTGDLQQCSILILGVGSMAEPAFAACSLLQQSGLPAAACAVDQVKPLSQKLTNLLTRRYQLVVTVEENSRLGGFGAAVLEHLSEKNICQPVLVCGLPDTFIRHGERQKILEDFGLSGSGIEQAVRQYLSSCQGG